LKIRGNKTTREIERNHYVMLSKMDERSMTIQKSVSRGKLGQRPPHRTDLVKFPIVKILSFACHPHANKLH
jgi:hypothetical protein